MKSKIYNDEKLKNMFVNMSTNKDLRNIISYYNENNMNKDDIKGDFLELIEEISTEEIADRISIDLYINFEGTQITNNELDESLCFNENIKDVQLEYISKRSDLSYLAIQEMTEKALPATIDIAIKNSTNKELYKIESDKMCLLNKNSILKLYDLSKDKYKDNLLYYLSLQKNLKPHEIDFILSEMKEREIQMDNLYAEGLLSQIEITKEQEKQIATFDKIPTAMVLEMCLEKDLYTKDELLEIYNKSFYKDKQINEEISNILLNSTRTPKEVLSTIYVKGDKMMKEKIEQDMENDIVLQENIRKLTDENLTKRDTIQLEKVIDEDVRILPYAIKSTDPNLLNAALKSIDKFYSETMRPEVYEKRVELIRELSNNPNINNLTLRELLIDNSDAFDQEEVDERLTELEFNLTDFEEKVIEQEGEENMEALDDYILRMKEESHREYNDQAYEYMDRDDIY